MIAPRLRSFWRGLVERHRIERELDEEIRFHLECRTEDLIRAGMPPAAAARRARLDFGGVEGTKVEVREARGLRLADELRADLRLALRGVRAHWGFAVVAIAILALAIGANSALWSVYQGLVLRPLPIRAPERHIEIVGADAQARIDALWTLDDLEVLRRGAAAAFEGVYGFLPLRRPLTDAEGGTQPRMAQLEAVSGNYFGLLGVGAERGRVFGPAEDRAPGSDPVMVLSHAGWHRLFAADPSVVGRRVRVGERWLTVIGVLGERSTGTDLATPDAWIPLAMARTIVPAAGRPGQEPDLEVGIAGLLERGVSIAAASDLASALLLGAPRSDAEPNAPVTVRIERWSTVLRARDASALAGVVALLFAAFGLVLAIACANLAGLFLARAASRERELATRLALGASRGRLVRQLLTETTLLSVLGGVAGSGLCIAAVPWLERWAFAEIRGVGISIVPIGFDLRGLVFALVLGLVAGIAFGLLPALDATAPELGPQRRSRRHLLSDRSGARTGRLCDVLIVGQIAASLVLLAVAALLLDNARGVDRLVTGLDLDRLVDLRNSEPGDELRRTLDGHPAVAGVAAAMRTPLSGVQPRIDATVDGRGVSLGVNRVDERFLPTLAIPIVRGRNFTRAETVAAARHAIVSEATARRLWPGREPLGRTFDLVENEGAPAGRYQVVGVAGDIVSGLFFEGPDRTAVYLPAAFGAPGVGELVIAVRGSVPLALAELRRVCSRVDPETLCEPTTLREMVAIQRLPFSIASGVASCLGGVGLGLTAIGLYGLVSFLVARRQRELAVRMALGASRGRMLGATLADSLRLVAIGVSVGLPICLAASKLASLAFPQLAAFGVDAYLFTPLGLAAVALAAAFPPAWRGASVAPARLLGLD